MGAALAALGRSGERLTGRVVVASFFIAPQNYQHFLRRRRK